jgi:quinol monooxygenase YgiN
MFPLTVVAKVVAKKEFLEVVKSELIKMIGPTRKEPGCIAYNLHQDNQDPAVFIFYETWENPACLDRHMDTEHFKSYVQAVGDLIGEKIVHKMTQIE